jgi:hypothetical protein
MSPEGSWEEVWAELRPALAEIASRVNRLLPEFNPQISTPTIRGPYFDGYLSFVRDRMHQELEDLLLMLNSAPPANFRNAGNKLALPAADPSVTAMGFSFQTGGGEVVRQLDPIILPGELGSPEFEAAARAYAQAAAKFALANFDVVVAELQAAPR